MKNIIAILTLLLAQSAYAGDKCFIEVIEKNTNETVRYDYIYKLKNEQSLLIAVIKDTHGGLEYATIVEVMRIESNLIIHTIFGQFNPTFRTLQNVSSIVFSGAWNTFFIRSSGPDMYTIAEILVGNHCNFN